MVLNVKTSKIQKTNKGEKGITLIALVVTLVVLIILAVISVNALLGDDGLITKANDAKKHQSNAIAMEKGDLDQLDTKSSNTIKEHLEGPANAIGKILEEGNYVWYTNNDGTQQKCIVLYGPENKNYSKYGVQIITEETLGEITIGNSKTNIPEGQSSADTNDFNVARQSYNDIVTNLNKKANDYLNKTYASSARSVGTIPDNPESEGEYYEGAETYMESYNGTIRGKDTNFKTDWDQLNALGIAKTSEDYCLASRFFQVNGSDTNFLVRTISNGSLRSYGVCTIFDNNQVYSFNYTRNIRPVFVLNSNLLVESGTGTKEDPYVLGF